MLLCGTRAAGIFAETWREAAPDGAASSFMPCRCTGERDLGSFKAVAWCRRYPPFAVSLGFRPACQFGSVWSWDRARADNQRFPYPNIACGVRACQAFS